MLLPPGSVRRAPRFGSPGRVFCVGRIRRPHSIVARPKPVCDGKQTEGHDKVRSSSQRKTDGTPGIKKAPAKAGAAGKIPYLFSLIQNYLIPVHKNRFSCCIFLSATNCGCLWLMISSPSAMLKCFAEPPRWKPPGLRLTLLESHPVGYKTRIFPSWGIFSRVPIHI